jgi:hypothetical protein
MNVVFLSPNFPTQYYLFCRALRQRGVTVIGIGEARPEELPQAVRDSLEEYVYVPRMERYDDLLRGCGYITWKYGKIDHIDSLNEHWLSQEARLREDFSVPGLRPDEVARYRNKLSMGKILQEAGLAPPEEAPGHDAEAVRALAARRGFPLIVKPNLGSGAELTRQLSSSEELEAALQGSLAGFVVQEFIRGQIVTFDGLVGLDRELIFTISFAYAAGVLEFLRDQLDVVYYSRRLLLPPGDPAGARGDGPADGGGLRSQEPVLPRGVLPAPGRLAPDAGGEPAAPRRADDRSHELLL